MGVGAGKQRAVAIGSAGGIEMATVIGAGIATATAIGAEVAIGSAAGRRVARAPIVLSPAAGLAGVEATMKMPPGNLFVLSPAAGLAGVEATMKMPRGNLFVLSPAGLFRTQRERSRDRLVPSGSSFWARSSG